MASQLTHAGDNSATWLQAPDEPGPALYLAATEWALLPTNSRLRNLLTVAYPSLPAFMQAFGAAGGRVDTQKRTTGGTYMPSWSLDENGQPRLNAYPSYPYFPGNEPSVEQLTGIVRVSLAHSISE